MQKAKLPQGSTECVVSHCLIGMSFVINKLSADYEETNWMLAVGTSSTATLILR